jgi:hypothetical protein
MPTQFKFALQHSPWLLLLCLGLAIAYAWLLYSAKAPWPAGLNRALAGVRGVVVFVILVLLLLNPLILQRSYQAERATVVLAIDNSASLALVHSPAFLDSLRRQLNALEQRLKGANIDTDIQLLTSSELPKGFAWDSLRFDGQETNLQKMLRQVQNNYENRNLDKVVLLSDGIHNQGLSPAFVQYPFPIYSVGLGDPTPKRDIRLATILANKIAYQGNRFPIVAEVAHNGYTEREVQVYLSQQGRVIDRKTVRLGDDEGLSQVTLYAEAAQKGMQRYTVSVDVLPGEFNKENNSRDVYVEVIDGREKILIAAAAPHPDLKALRAALANKDNYSLEIYIPGVTPEPKEARYDLVVLHQIPNRFGRGNELIKRYEQSARWFILGTQSDVNTFNQQKLGLRIDGRMGQVDKVTPALNAQFSLFTLEATQAERLRKYPPLTVPFGEYTLTGEAQVLLYQRVGNIETEKPLLLLNNTGEKPVGILTGDGLWQWRMEEFDLSDNHEAVDELLTKTVQLLTTKEDKRRLRVYPTDNEFYDFQKISFETELYNAIYERVYDTKISLTITDEEGQQRRYNYTPTAGNTRFDISSLPKGVYRYAASANVQGKTETVGGEFVVKSVQLESIQTTADHALLQQLSDNSGGAFFAPQAFEQLAQALIENRKPDLLHSSASQQSLIHWYWLFGLFLALLTLEWVLRKYQGGY